MNGYGVSPLEMMACEAMLNGVAFLDEFVYSAAWIKGTSTELGALATVPVQIQINSDSDFIFQEENLVSFLGGDILDNPNYLLTVVRAGSGREVMNQAQHVLNITGSHQSLGRVPGRKATPGLIQANSTLTCNLQNLTSDVPDRVDLAMIGFKVFYITNPSNGQTGNRQMIFHAL
jgi:hypothetical protein